jgi:hypothetical protein
MGLAQCISLSRGRIPRDLLRKADARLASAVDEARRSQDASGLFRLEWGVFPPVPEGAKSLPPLPSGISDLLSHQGHTLEWLMVALSDDQLARLEWPHRGVAYLVQVLGARGNAISLDAHAHCIHALRLYEERVRKIYRSEADDGIGLVIPVPLTMTAPCAESSCAGDAR